MRKAFVRTGALVCLALATVAAPAFAQVSMGEIFGKVTDGTGAMLPGVTVTISGPALIQSETVMTAASGGYRVPRIPVGTYTVAFELAGFRKTVREGVVIQAGFNAEIDAKLDLSTVQETVTVSGESPVVDTRSTALNASFSREALETIPTARDPWVILQQTPGMVMSGQNVGGNLSGQQTSFSAMGSSNNQQWTMDGAVVSDIASGNSSPTYYDFDSFEEINVTKGGSDASQQGAGVQVNFITKSGGNSLRGSARYFDVNDSMESNNITSAQRDLGATGGNPIQHIQDYGFEIGGPIVKNKFWYWGTASKNRIDVGVVNFFDTDKAGCSTVATNASTKLAGDYQYAVKDLWNCYKTDNTMLINQNGKLQYQEASNHKSTFVVTNGIKTRNARGADAFHPLITTRRQDGPTIFYRGEHQWIASSRLTMTAQYTHIHEDWGQFFQNDGLFDVQAIQFIDTGFFDRNSASGNYKTSRPQDDIRADGNYYLSSVLKGDHAMKFGFSYRRSPVESITTYGGGANIRYRSTANMGACSVGGVSYASGATGCQEADIRRDADFSYILYSQSAYWNDSYKTGRATVNVGVRFDRQYDIARAASIPANRIIPALLPAVNFAGADAGVRYDDLSPRLGFTYDLRGNGKTVLKANAARYYGLGMSTASRIQPTGSTTLRYAWRDLNNDTVVQANELDLSRFLTTPSANYDPANPSSVTTPNKIDPGLTNDKTDEFALGVEHEIMNSLGLSVFYYHRKYSNFQRLYRTADFSKDFVPVTLNATCGNAATCGTQVFTGTYYQRPGTVGLNPSQVFRNDGRYFTYDGLEISGRKRLSHHYMFSGSVVLNREREYLPQADRDYLDPTNIAFTNGFEGGSSVQTATTWPVGSNQRQLPWVAKLGGMYQFPWQITAAANVIGQNGAPLNPYLQSPNRTSSLGTVNILLQQVNSIHYDNYYQLDLHADKGLRLGANRRITLNADLFNVFNNNVVLTQVERQNTATANNISSLLAPRVARFGVRIMF
jgi:carboxypeptidase family protein/TonB-dependent receptor-like protein